jgi:hypothetical protein
MTKIILAFPCMGKTHYAKNHPTKALDLESSDYFYDRTGYEHLSSEEFKGIPDRKPKENGLQNYIKAIDQATRSNHYDYIFTAQNPEVVRGILTKGHSVIIVKPYNTEETKRILTERARARGNNDTWIKNVLKFFTIDPEHLYSEEELEKISVLKVSGKAYLTDIIQQELI